MKSLASKEVKSMYKDTADQLAQVLEDETAHALDPAHRSVLAHAYGIAYTIGYVEEYS